MNLNNETVDVLKNFSSINQNILFEEGNTLRTMSTMKNILAEAEISEHIPKEFGIYDLNELLGVLSLSKNPDINLDHESYLKVNGKKFFSEIFLFRSFNNCITPINF